MAIGETAAALIGASIGAGGAVLAQITASAFSGRRDGQRLAWERSKQERDDAFRRQERFIDLKRDLYGRFIATCDQIMNQVEIYLLTREAGTLADWSAQLAELGILESNIELVATDELAAKVTQAYMKVESAYYSAKSDEDRGFEAHDALITARAGLKADLQGPWTAQS